MRAKLAGLEGQSHRFTAMLVRFGNRGYGGRYQNKYKRRTALLRNVCRGTCCVADHLWVDYNKALQTVQARVGDILSFRACVKPYARGLDRAFRKVREGRDVTLDVDYHLTALHDVFIIGHKPIEMKKPELKKAEESYETE